MAVRTGSPRFGIFGARVKFRGNNGFPATPGGGEYARHDIDMSGCPLRRRGQGLARES
jgi:hypothetical protein